MVSARCDDDCKDTPTIGTIKPQVDAKNHFHSMLPESYACHHTCDCKLEGGRLHLAVHICGGNHWSNGHIT